MSRLIYQCQFRNEIEPQIVRGKNNAILGVKLKHLYSHDVVFKDPLYLTNPKIFINPTVITFEIYDFDNMDIR